MRTLSPLKTLAYLGRTLLFIEKLAKPDSAKTSCRENTNSISAVFWMMYELLQRPIVLSEAEGEILISQFWIKLNSATTMKLDLLCNMPLLQSMYTRTLRLYTSLFSLRSFAHGDIDFLNFKIPKAESLEADSYVTATARSVWSMGGSNGPNEEQTHPLDRFWAKRFLGYPNDPTSGPSRSDPL